MRANLPTPAHVWALLLALIGGCAEMQIAGEAEVQSRRRAVLEQRERVTVATDDWPEPASARNSLEEEPLAAVAPNLGEQPGQTLEQNPPTAASAPRDTNQPPEERGFPAGLAVSEMGSPAEESVAQLIRADTPPQVAAALRCIEQGRTLLQKGQLEAAREWFERALTLDGNNPYAYFFLARLALRSGREDQADAFLERASTLASRAPSSWRSRILALRGEVLEAVGRFPEARQAYHEAAHLDPGNPGARAGLARLSAPN